MEFDFSSTSQQLFEDLSGKEEEKRQITEETVKKIQEDNAQSLMNQRKEEFAAAMAEEKGKFIGIGGGFKKVESYADVVSEVKKEEQREKEKKDYYASSSKSSPTTSRFGATVTTTTTTQTSEEKKAKAIESYVEGLKDELNNIGKSIKGNIKANAAISELERKVDNDRPWTIKELQQSHETFVTTGGGRYVTKSTKRTLTKMEARDLRKLKKEFDRDKDILGFLVGGLKLWKD